VSLLPKELMHSTQPYHYPDSFPRHLTYPQRQGKEISSHLSRNFPPEFSGKKGKGRGGSNDDKETTTS